MTPWLRSCQRVAALALLMLGAGGAMAQPCTRLPADRSVSDGHGGCLALVPIGPPRNPPQVLIVALHGDRGGELEARHLDGWSRAAAALAGEHRRVLLMIRPGYRSPAGHSSGWANPQDDDYTAANVARVAGALATLRQDLQPRHLVLIGHSGGAATAALVLGRHPGVVDAALLLGCPCDVPPWRTHRSAQRGQA